MTKTIEKAVLITDFDGTITDFDFYELVYPRLTGTEIPDYFAAYQRGEVTHFDCMNGFFSHITCSEAELEKVVWNMQPEPRFAECVAALQERGWDLQIVSAGCHWYIDKVLAHFGVSLPVFACPGYFAPGKGLVMELPVGSPFLSVSTGIDKPAVVAAAQQQYERVVFAGNGPPDLAPALLVAPANRFARGWLTEELTRLGQPFRPFSRWSEVTDALLSESL
ncbi:MAG: HAD-IB family phosphatase [Blastocatellia bacterium]|nr:HAD-IB family phosphatase [Blastocatellia bacterium]